MAGKYPYRSLMMDTQEYANDYMRLLNELIPKRESTIREIKVIARELKEVQQDVGIAKVVGGSVAVAGGVAAVVGTVLTGGLAGPLLIGGFAAATAGGLTSTGAGIAQKFISKGKLKSAQNVLNDDTESSRRIEEVQAKFSLNVQELSRKLKVEVHKIRGLFLMGLFMHKENQTVVLDLLGEKFLVPLIEMLGEEFGIDSVIGKGIAEILTEGSVKGAAKMSGRIAGRVLVGVILVLDIYSLVTDSINLAKGSPSGASDNLEDTANELAKQLRDLKYLLKNIGDKRKRYEREIRKEIRRKDLERYQREQPRRRCCWCWCCCCCSDE